MATSDGMTRRQAMQHVSTLLGVVAFVDGDRLLAVAREPAAQETAGSQAVGTFTAEDIAFLDEIAETILPETSTPGARAARTGAFMALMVTDAYTPRNRQIFRDGMRRLDEACRREHGAAFVQARPEHRLALLQRLDAEQKAELDEREAARRRSRAPAAPVPGTDAPVHYFRMMKELTLLGYFTSEIGYRRAMRYIETPGRYDPCTPHKPGDKVWASHA